MFTLQNMDANVTTLISTVVPAIIGAAVTIYVTWLNKKSPSPPKVEKGLALIDRWDELTDLAHEKSHAFISALWAFSNGKRYYDGSHAQVMNMLSCCVPTGMEKPFTEYQNMPIRIMDRYIRGMRPGEIRYFDENEAPNNPIAREHLSHGINTIAVYPIFQQRRFFPKFRDKILIQVIVMKFHDKHHRLTPEQLTDIELISFQLERLKE